MSSTSFIILGIPLFLRLYAGLQGGKWLSGNIDSFGNQVTTVKIVKRITFRIDKKKQITNSQVPT